MSDVNFNVTDDLAGSGGSFVGSIQTQQSVLGADANFTSSTESQVASVQVSITTSIANETVEVGYVGHAQQIGATYAQISLGAKVDSDATLWFDDTDFAGGSGVIQSVTGTRKITISTPGVHLIKLMAANPQNAGTARLLAASSTAASIFQVTQYGGGSKLITVTETTLAADFTIVQAFSDVDGAGMAQVDSVQLTVTTVANERLLINYNGCINSTGNVGFRDAILGYQIDSNTPVVCGYWNHESATGDSDLASFSRLTAALSAGTHIIKLTASKSNTNGAILKGYPGSNNAFKTSFQATQFGGDNQATSWVAFTPTGAWTTNSTYTGMYRKIGDTLECRVKIALAGAPNSAQLTVNLPAGFTIDTAKMLSPSADITLLMGVAIYRDTGVGSWHGNVAYSSTTSVRLYVSNTSGTYLNPTSVDQATPFSFGNTDFVEFTFSVPVL